MSQKTLNPKNLAALGADRLAALLIEVSTGSADIKRRLRMELSYNLGASELAYDVRKRLAAISKSKARVSWRKRKSLVIDLNIQVAMIVDRIAPDDPTTAFDLLWQFIELAPSIYARADDRRGDIITVFHGALQHFEDIGPRAQINRSALAERVWLVVSENIYGEWNDIIGLLAETLGKVGFSALEVTFRTAHAASAIAAMRKACPDLHIGAGTITGAAQFDAACAAGSDFLVSPGTGPTLFELFKQATMPVFPGIATPSEALAAY